MRAFAWMYCTMSKYGWHSLAYYLRRRCAYSGKPYHAP